MTGSVMAASINEMEKSKFLDGCSKLYDAYKDFGQEMDKLADRIKKQ
jgi:hypothetical protein